MAKRIWMQNLLDNELNDQLETSEKNLLQPREKPSLRQPIKKKPSKISTKDRGNGGKPGQAESIFELKRDCGEVYFESEASPRGKPRPPPSRRRRTAAPPAPSPRNLLAKRIPEATSSGAPRTKRSKPALTHLLPNPRLYQPAPRRQLLNSTLPQTSQPKDLRAITRPGRQLWPAATTPAVLCTASSFINELTEQISPLNKHQSRAVPKKNPSTRKQRAPIPLSVKTRASLVVNVPKVEALSEPSSPERIRRVFREELQQGDSRGRDETPNRKSVPTTSCSPLAFRQILERFEDSAWKPSDSENCEQVAYSATSSYLRRCGPKIISSEETNGSRLYEINRRELLVASPRSAVDDEYTTSLRTQSLETQRAIASTSSLYRDFINGIHTHTTQSVQPKKQVHRMSGKERAGHHSTSAEDSSDGNETLSAPSEFLAEFLSAIMQRKYVSALKYCKLILQYEPNNVTAKEFYPLLEEKLKTADRDEGSSGAEPPAEGPHTDPSDGTAPEQHNTDDKEDSSYNSDDSYILDDELEEEDSARGGSGDGAARASAADSPLTSTRTRSSRRATDSDRSLPSSGGETDNWAANLSGSGCDDDDSCRLDADDDNGNAVSVTVSARHPSAAAIAAAAASARYAAYEENDNEAPAASSASNDNYRKQQEELRRSKIQQLRSQYVHTVN